VANVTKTFESRATHTQIPNWAQSCSLFVPSTQLCRVVLVVFGILVACTAALPLYHIILYKKVYAKEGWASFRRFKGIPGPLTAINETGTRKYEQCQLVR